MSIQIRLTKKESIMEDTEFDIVEAYEKELTTSSNPSAYSSSDSINVLDVNEYVFVEEALKNEGGFKSGNYLIPHLRESFYKVRKQYSSYVNFIQPILRAMVEPVFNGDINREYKDNDLFEMFIKDVNYNNLSLKDFTQMITKYVRLHSLVFIICDYILPSGELSEAQLLENNVHPYLYFKKPYEVESYALDFFGRLNTITFIDDELEIIVEGKKKKVQTFIKWSSMTWERVIKNDKGSYVTIETREHNLGKLPISVVYEEARENTKELLTASHFYSLARINHQIYNQDSERRELQRNQAFSVLYIQEENNNQAGRNIGTNNYLSISHDATIPPNFISPDVSILEKLLEQRNTAKDDLFSIADQMGVFGVTKQAKSGIALAYEFSAYEGTLRKTATIANRVELEIVRLFSMYTKLNLDFKANYNEDYTVSKDENKITVYDTVQNWPISSPTLNAKIAESTAKILFPDIEDAEIEQIKSEVSVIDNELDNEGNTVV